MPTSQQMHKIVAKHPIIQMNLFLLLDALTHQHLLCARNAFIGRRKYDLSYRPTNEPTIEDGFATNGDLGVASLLRALIKALEAQGRGFAHGHEKCHSETSTKFMDLARLLLLDEVAAAMPCNSERPLVLQNTLAQIQSSKIGRNVIAMLALRMHARSSTIAPSKPPSSLACLA